MKIWVPTTWLLLALLCMPSHLTAQTQAISYTVSVRELSIPHNALHSFDQGLDCLAKKDAGASLPHFQRAISEFSGYYEAYDRIGAADLQLWRVPEAEQAFRKAIELSDARFAHPLLALGAILDDEKKFAEAATLARKGLDLDPDSWTGHYYLGLALSGLNRLQEADKIIREALRLKPVFPQALLLLADIHSRQKDYLSLVSDLNEYLEIAPEGPNNAGIKALRDSARRMILESQSTSALAGPQP